MIYIYVRERGVLYSCDAMSGGRDGWMSSSGCAWAQVLYMRRRRIWESGVDLREYTWVVRMVCADADGKCVRDVFILVRGLCCVSHVCVSTKGK